VRRLDLSRELPLRLSGALVLVTVGTLLWLERRRPLRPRVEPRPRHDARNVAFASLSFLALSKLEKPVVLGLSRRVQKKRWGLLKVAALPAWLEVALAVVLLDYTIWIWHVLTHRSRFLWRFHGVHHTDLDLTVTTALRFHFVEMILSIPWRAGQVLVVGAAPLALTTWQTTTLLAILIHHADVRLPLRLERRLARWVMTPRLHGIHHSTRLDETDSNWSTIFVWPDRLHGTFRFHERPVTIGTGTDRRLLDLASLVTLPLRGELRAQRSRASASMTRPRARR
jgi:sterol desaturase/sphingolipid hydroxylase (fatty acid hydroxylase superfamily)